MGTALNNLYEIVTMFRRQNPCELDLFYLLKDQEGRWGVLSLNKLRQGSLAEDKLESDGLALELLHDVDPKERCGWFASPAEAVADHDLAFE